MRIQVIEVNEEIMIKREGAKYHSGQLIKKVDLSKESIKVIESIEKINSLLRYKIDLFPLIAEVVQAVREK